MIRQSIASRIDDVTRPHLLHVIPDLCVNGCYSMALTLSQELKKEYHHTIVAETPQAFHESVIWQAQGYGLDVLFLDRITPESLEQISCTGMILYNIEGRPGIGQAHPSIYYSYGVYDPTTAADVTVVPSAYAKRRLRDGSVALMDAVVIPPMLSTRAWRNVRGPNHAFTAAVLTSGYRGKYPGELVSHLLGQLPNDVPMFVTDPKDCRHPGVRLALDTRQRQAAMRVVPVEPLLTYQVLLKSDLLIYGSSETHHEPYGRLVMEALSLGKVVVCENRGVFPEVLEHNKNAFLFDSPTQAVEQILRIQKDKYDSKMLAANMRLKASWEDVAVHIGRFKRLLRMLGA